MAQLLITANTGAYQAAADAFCKMFRSVTGRDILVSDKDDGQSDLFLLGTDAVNDVAAREILEGHIGSLDLRYGTDDYRLLSFDLDGRRAVLLAGGRPRSTLYAVYDYFERYAGCHYFWDGDIIPHLDDLPMEGIDVKESPRFEYRGLRYFAHRGLKRFQAEHWSFEDWKKELDWMAKKRLNFFMLRIGMDDVWQRAFPEDVPYPEEYENINYPADFYNADGKLTPGYNDRSDLWKLRYRGELREKVLAYARDLDLSYPTDCGTMTHWYSRTPTTFLEAKQPTFLEQCDRKHNENDTGKVFDFRQKQNMDYYMKLTETMVEEYDKQTALFHTIGLGERKIYPDKQKNFTLKLFTYRRILESIRERFPDSTMMIAAWDFIGWWTPEEVQGLLKEFDPEKTIILDYTSEADDPEICFLNWGVVGKFPWIFGLFHSFESESELRGPYDRSCERLKVAAEDPYCKGMVLWPELSHSDPIILEFLTQNAWSPLANTVEGLVENFSKARYGENAAVMNDAWQHMLPLIKLGDWGEYSRRPESDPHRYDFAPNAYAHLDLWTRLTVWLQKYYGDAALAEYYRRKLAAEQKVLPSTIKALEILSTLGPATSDRFVLRDTVDMVRTALGRYLNLVIVSVTFDISNKDYLRAAEPCYFELLAAIEEVLALNPGDFSIYQTLEEMRRVAPVNPRAETIIKHNIHNRYSAQPACELIKGIYVDEARLVFDWLKTAAPDTEKPDFEKQIAPLVDRFYDKPLAELQPDAPADPGTVIRRAIDAIRAAAKVLDRA